MDKKKSPSFFSRLGIAKERDYLVENLSMLTGSGMDVLGALQAIRTETRTKAMQTIIDQMIADIDAGSALWRALGGAKIMPEQVLALIRIGEESGRLSQNLGVVALSQAKERSFKSKVRSAMMYPVLVLVITFVVALGIAWFILPRLSVVFSQLDVELPFITQVLIGVGEFFRMHGAIAVPALLVVFSAIMYVIFFYKKTKIIGQEILFFIPPIRKLIQEVELARFGYVFGTLLEAGLPIVDSLESVERSTTFARFQRFYGHIKNKVDEGMSMRKSFASYKGAGKLIPIPVQHLITSGEQSGRLSQTLQNVGKTYEAKIDDTTKNLSTLLEPILLVVVWLGVVGVAVAVILPVYSLIQGVN
jgi:type IV pilus assembly protein PilC